MIKDHNIFFDKEKIENIARLVEGDIVKAGDYNILNN
jgi:hypothetical protein